MNTSARTTRAPEARLRALTDPRYLLTFWPWEGLAHILSGTVVAGVLFSVAAPLFLPWMLSLGLAVTRPDNHLVLIGVLVLVGVLLTVLFGPLVGIPAGIVERWRLRLLRDTMPAGGHRPSAEPGLGPWLRTRYGESASWREVAYAGSTVFTHAVFALVLANFAIFAFLLAISPVLAEETTQGMALGPVTLHTAEEALPYTLLAPVCIAVMLYLAGLFAGFQTLLARALITGPPPEVLRAELDEVNESRARLVSAFAHARRRIERALHDGTQPGLVAIRMDLGMARLGLEEGSEAENRVISAQTRTEELIDELRELIRGIHPRVLADRGLSAALNELADRCSATVSIKIDLPHRPPPHVEGTAYFVVAEALTNVHKHTEADTATVHAHLDVDGDEENVIVEVIDHGPGGADPARGSGLTGMADRVAVMGGTMELSSPEGGPTRIRVELPCTTEHLQT